LRAREGAFDRYKGQDVEIVGYTSCGGCPGDNIEYAPEEMKKNGADVIHFATGFVVGYPPCPHIAYFKKYIEEAFGLEVVVGTHPIPEKYVIVHEKLGTWNSPEWQEWIRPTFPERSIRKDYD